MKDIIKKCKKKVKSALLEVKKTTTDKCDCRMSEELEEIKSLHCQKNKVWAFCAGHYSKDFRGNPKYLFIYINKYRPDIFAWWLCPTQDLTDYIRQFGFNAYCMGTPEAEEAINKTGVFVDEKVKNYIPKGMENVKYLNLWHGVGGAKAVERALISGVLEKEIAQKYIAKNTFYRNNQLYLAPSPMIVDIAKEQLGLDESQIIKAGYPRCLYQKLFDSFKSFEHDFFVKNGLPEDTKIVAYAPTFRNEPHGELFAQAIPNIEQLIEVCRENHLLMIFKMHPMLEKELSFLQAKENYKDCPWLCFWDNENDFYEIMDKVDLCITDYSSIFTDFIAAGTKHYIRYIVDFDPEKLDFPLGYDEAVIGRKCHNFFELLEAIKEYEKDDLTTEIKRIQKMHWPYADNESFEKIIESTLKFECKDKKYPILYSFDIFDTLISRKVLAPEGIFVGVQEKMRNSDLEYSRYFVDNYPKLRKNAEANVREYFNRSKAERDDERCEIQFDHIFKRLNDLYGLTIEQINQLKKWEIELELENTIPLKQQINYVKELLEGGNTVILISDMYLPKEIIQKMLVKADPVLGELPLYLSSEYGYQKSAQNLYLQVYKHYAPDYPFGKWIHHGDNTHSDIKMPKKLNIRTCKIEKPEFNEFEKKLVGALRTYDAYLLAAEIARFRTEHNYSKEEFVYSFVSLLFVPYIYWAVHDALKKGDKILYFISRDGYHLKRIADTIIENEKLDIKTKYIYASRRTWRIPSFIDHIDIGFWSQGYGNLAKVNSYKKLLKALNMNEAEFTRIFPALNNINEETDFKKINILELTDVIKTSKEYEEFLLNVAAEERKPVCAYLEQEMSKDEQFSIVEYWGRGYTQENFTRLWHQVMGKEVPVVFYYSRSTLPSDKYNIRKNYTSHPNAQQFIESIFANMPYKSIEKYEYRDNKWIPEIVPISCDEALFYNMSVYLPRFTEAYCRLEFTDRDGLGRELIDFAMTYYAENQDADIFVKNLAPLIDSVEMFGDKKEYAKALTMNDLQEIKAGKTRKQITKSLTMSYYRATSEVQKAYKEMFQIYGKEALTGGAKISDGDILKNQVARTKLDKYKEQLHSFNELYYVAQKNCNVKHKIVFLYKNTNSEKDSFMYLKRMLEKQNKYEVSLIEANESKITLEKLALELAEARYILIDEPIDVISEVTFRKETELILSVKNPISYLSKGVAKKAKLHWEKEYADLKYKNVISLIEISSVENMKTYKESFYVDELTKYNATGCCATDIYFDKEYAEKRKEEVLSEWPAARGKKIIAYIPAKRYRNKAAKYLQLLDISMLKEQLGSEYFLFIDTEKNVLKDVSNQVEYPDFSENVTGKISFKDLMIVADIIIGDYKVNTFEAVLMKKPLYLTVWDREEYEQNHNVIYPYDSLIAGEIVSDTRDLLDKLKYVDSYDYSLSNAFREKYLTYCDGKSSERMFQYLMRED